MGPGRGSGELDFAGFARREKLGKYLDDQRPQTHHASTNNSSE